MTRDEPHRGGPDRLSRGRGIVVESVRLTLPAIVVHGGAGTFERTSTPDDEQLLVEGLRDSLSAAWSTLSRGGRCFDAVVEAVAALEDSGRFNAGRGGALTTGGELELDASVMDGETGRTGAVCASSWPRNPVRAAAAVSALGGPTDGPILLAGAGADLFAVESGLPKMDRPPARAGVGSSRPGPSSHGASPHGTVGAVAVDSDGHVAAATSTGGRSGQRRGRVGDSPIVGAGTWADDETVAVSATGEGELFVVAGFAHAVDWALRGGCDLETAMRRSITDVARRGGSGGAISLSPSGDTVCVFDTRAMARGWRDPSGERIAVLER